MKFKSVRTIVLVAVFLVLAAAIIAGVSVGTVCGIGWGDIAVLCPVGALLSMISARTLVPRALLSLAVAAVAVLVLGRAFCGWACPVSLWRKLQGFFTPKERAAQELEQREKTCRAIGEHELALAAGDPAPSGCAACGACKHEHRALDSRHAVLGGAIVASAAFGFPVFCLACPVGLSFALVVLLVNLFGAGELTWSLVVVPVLLVLELTVLRKWCSRICPISAIINLVGRFSRTLRPQIDDGACLETSKGVACGRCGAACSYDVNLRHPEYGELPVVDCARCMECADACPAGAIHLVAVSAGSRERAVALPPNEGAARGR